MFQRGLWLVWFKSCAHLWEMESSPVDLHGLNRVIVKLGKRNSSEEGNVCRQTMCTSSAWNISGQIEYVIDKKIKIRMYLVLSKFFCELYVFLYGYQIFTLKVFFKFIHLFNKYLNTCSVPPFFFALVIPQQTKPKISALMEPPF